ncbi:ATPase AAA domain-containing protein 2B [Gryganskiella cystojenkinii]|nr:ATPase AAA domain-containing protein 2B [Gryganskiella cystojenkinii]
MEDNPAIQPEDSTQSAANDPYKLKRAISSDDDARHETQAVSRIRAESTPIDHSYSEGEVIESKRRRIHSAENTGSRSRSAYDDEDDGNQEISSNSMSSRRITHSSQEQSNLGSGNRSTRTSTMTTTTSTITNDTSPFLLRDEVMERRRSIKRVNYADPEESEEEEEEEEAEEEEQDEDEDEEEDIMAPPNRSSRNFARQSSRRSSSNRQNDESDEESIVKQEDDKSETTEIPGQRTLRDRRSIVAPKPFPVGNPTPSKTRRPNGGRRYEDENIYRSNPRHLAPKRPPPVARTITENMRITRGMRTVLAPDTPSPRDSPDIHSVRGRTTRNSSRYQDNLSSDEEHNGEHDEEEDGEEPDEEMEDDDAGNNSMQSTNPEENGVRMTRLRSRLQSQPQPRHVTMRPSSRPKPSQPRTSRQDLDRKYDLRERPKNRPTYIADRPIPSPTRPRNARVSSFTRDPFSRPRQNRSSFLEALGRAAGSDSDEIDLSSFKRRSGNSDSRSSSRILPMNMHELGESRRDVIAARAGQPADVDPLAIGNNVDFDKVGGLDHHIKSLKEMVILPLLYPEVYSHFQMMPPRGVLFHGPPGTGKTLLARALASSCSTETQKVAFFMRKGADCLSKWVGEAERQLRLLFEEAKAWQPSIIFFDEIDGLCPVRSSKQEQIHASIVSTMLALMDGLDGRGQVIVIGATNRIDAIDPALRRPGRFDREFYFPLPNEAARRAIIDINTSGWVPALNEDFKNELARITTRYCGADIKALCTEAALKAIRRRYPQIYESNDKLLIDANTIVVEEVDMLKSAKALTPASYRVTGATASPLPANLKPLLQDSLDQLCRIADNIVTVSNKKSSKNTEEDDDAAFQAMGYRSFDKLKTFRPRIIIAGARGMGQRYLGPALLHHLEGCTVQQFDLAALMSESSRTPEAACVQYFVEVKRHAPSVIYIPHIDVWWTVVSDAVKATFSNLLEDLNPEDGILFLATSETPLAELPITIRRWFLSSAKGRVELHKPQGQSRALFFDPLLQDLAREPTDFIVPSTEPAKLEPLKKAPPPQPRVPTTEEKKLLREHDQYVLRELRISLRTIVEELLKERKFKPFFQPVDLEEFPDYLEVIKKPMDLATINSKINDRAYLEVKEFVADIDLIVSNTTEYNETSKIVYTARAFQDVVHAMVARFDPDLITETEKTAARVRQEIKANQRVMGERMSRRRLGLEAEAVPDNPEAFLRNRTVISRLAMDAAVRGDSMEPLVQLEGPTAEQMEDIEQSGSQPEKDREEEGRKVEESFQTPATIAEAPAVTSSLDQSRPQSMDVDTPREAVYLKMDSDLSMQSSDATPRNGSPFEGTPTPSLEDTGTHDLTVGFAALLEDEHQVMNPQIKPAQEPRVTTPASAPEPVPQQEKEAEAASADMVEEAIPVAEEEVPKVFELDQEAVSALKISLVKDTEHSTVEELDQLRAALYGDIWEHRHEWSKDALLSDMKETLLSVTSLHQEYRNSEQQAVDSFIDSFR